MNGDHERWTEDLLSGYLDDELTSAQRSLVESRVTASAEWRAALDEVGAARDAVRALPARDGPAEFWARLLAGTDTDSAEADDAAPVVQLAPRRSTRRSTRWFTAAGGAAAAAVIAAVVVTPAPEQVKPPVASFTDAHAVRASLDDDAVSTLAPIALQAGFRR